MKTPEEILKMQAGISPFMPLNPIVSTLDAITAMQLYSDQQNKELREKVEKWKWVYAMITKYPLMSDFAEEIQRLKKQVEELSWVEDEIDTAREWMKVHKGENSRYLQIQEENTRLRELLTKAKDYIFLGYVGAVELSDEIDNALNHKP